MANHLRQPRSSDEDEDSEMSNHETGDGIRRNYVTSVRHQQQQQVDENCTRQQKQQSSCSYAEHETIKVNLDESYFSNERRVLVNLFANCRQKFASMQLFNPAKNQSIKEQQQQSWNENVSLFASSRSRSRFSK